MGDENFKPFPVLKTERLTLRRLENADAHEIFVLRSDSEVNKYLDRQTAKTIDDARNFISTVNENIDKNISLYWAITFSDTNILVGTICLFSFSDGNDNCEIGYELLSDFNGRGIMKEAAGKVIEYALQKLQVQEILASTHKDNQRSARLLSKFGFKLKEFDRENPDINIFILTQSK